MRVKPAAPYSILNPETSSDSPSEKSKGVRLVSATQEINQSIRLTGAILKISIEVIVIWIPPKEIAPLSAKTLIKIIASLIS